MSNWNRICPVLLCFLLDRGRFSAADSILCWHPQRPYVDLALLLVPLFFFVWISSNYNRYSTLSKLRKLLKCLLSNFSYKISLNDVSDQFILLWFVIVKSIKNCSSVIKNIFNAIAWNLKLPPDIAK